MKNMRGIVLVLMMGFGLIVSGWLIHGQGNQAGPAVEPAAVPKKLHPVVIRVPDGPPMIATGEKDLHGNPIKVRCATCHALQKPNMTLNDGKDLTLFHQGLKLQHGGLTCVSCHNPNNYDELRLADGRPLPYRDVMQLCGQCHGPQLRDYTHGAHGGMTGYWDLSKGPRQRNNCIDCHDPHAPTYPKVQPVFPPRDRFPPVGAAHH
jgi:hypothetical protein